MYAKSTITINKILQAARELFVARNYADVTMKDISRAADMTKGALYHHFESKEDLYVTMMTEFLGEVQTEIESWVLTAGMSCRERLRFFTVSFLRLPDETHDMLRLVRRDINIFKDPIRRALIRAYQAAVPRQVETIIRQGVAQGELIPADPRLLSWEHVAMVEVALRPYPRSVFADAEQLGDYLIGLFFDGAAVRPGLDGETG
jgi:AcrR family transcriptional regulator